MPKITQLIAKERLKKYLFLLVSMAYKCFDYVVRVNKGREIMKESRLSLRDRIGADVYDDLVEFNRTLQDETSDIGKLLSMDRIIRGADHIEQAEMSAIVNNGHGVMLKD